MMPEGRPQEEKLTPDTEEDQPIFTGKDDAWFAFIKDPKNFGKSERNASRPKETRKQPEALHEDILAEFKSENLGLKKEVGEMRQEISQLRQLITELKSETEHNQKSNEEQTTNTSDTREDSEKRQEETQQKETIDEGETIPGMKEREEEGKRTGEKLMQELNEKEQEESVLSAEEKERAEKIEDTLSKNQENLLTTLKSKWEDFRTKTELTLLRGIIATPMVVALSGYTGWKFAKENPMLVMTLKLFLRNTADSIGDFFHLDDIGLDLDPDLPDHSEINPDQPEDPSSADASVPAEGINPPDGSEDAPSPEPTGEQQTGDHSPSTLEKGEVDDPGSDETPQSEVESTPQGQEQLTQERAWIVQVLDALYQSSHGAFAIQEEDNKIIVLPEKDGPAFTLSSLQDLKAVTAVLDEGGENIETRLDGIIKQVGDPTIFNDLPEEIQEKLKADYNPDFTAEPENTQEGLPHSGLKEDTETPDTETAQELPKNEPEINNLGEMSRDEFFEHYGFEKGFAEVRYDVDFDTVSLPEDHTLSSTRGGGEGGALFERLIEKNENGDLVRILTDQKIEPVSQHDIQESTGLSRGELMQRYNLSKGQLYLPAGHSFTIKSFTGYGISTNTLCEVNENGASYPIAREIN